ncbi:MAG: PAS domain S-box protein [Candidatus Hydrogenedentes bacterium]|nr:PAS domain S-box protein [Candidatus Hydrogenedentota bacterium]
MPEQDIDIRALAEAFEAFTRSTQTMEESYRRLETRLHELDRELEARNQELALTSDYLNSILESMSDGVIAVDNAERITTFNGAAGRVLGYSAADLIGNHFHDAFGREFAGPDTASFRELRAKDGHCVRVLERDSPLCDRNGTRIGVVKVFQDQTEIENLRMKIRQQDRLAAVGEMAATVAHEIRNPLGGIRGFAALLARDLDEGDPRRRLVAKIEVGAKELERVVSELLEYTRPIQLRLRPVSCAALVESALGYLEIGERPVAVVNGVDKNLHVHVDVDKMRQVFLNILLNAFQSIDGTGEIRISARAREQNVWVAIEDSGCGMTPAQREQVFSPFFTTKEKGTGLGLAVASKIVEAHGGVIEVESEPAKGSTFRVRLPQPE